MEMKWITFAEYRDEIIRIRGEVFVVEQKAPSHILESEQDWDCPHFAAFLNGTMIGVISFYTWRKEFYQCTLPFDGNEVRHITKFACLKKHRGVNLGMNLGRAAILSICEFKHNIDYVVLLYPKHHVLKWYYTRHFGFSEYTIINTLFGKTIALVKEAYQINDPYLRKMENAYNNFRKTHVVNTINQSPWTINLMTH